MKIFFFSLFLIFSATAQAATCSTDVCTVATATSVDVTRHSLCVTVANTSGSSILVPTKTAPELQSFIDAAAIGGIAKTTCVVSPSFGAISTRTLSSGTPVNNNKPTGLAVGDLMIALLYNSASMATIVAPTGFVAVPNHTNYTCSGSYRSTMFYKIADAGDVAAADNAVNWRFSMAGGFSDVGYMLTTWKNVNQTTPIETATHNSGSSSGITYLSATNANVGALAVIVSEAGSAPNTLPSGFTIASSLPAFGTEFSKMILSATGATGDYNATYSSSMGWCGALIILNP